MKIAFHGFVTGDIGKLQAALHAVAMTGLRVCIYGNSATNQEKRKLHMGVFGVRYINAECGEAVKQF